MGRGEGTKLSLLISTAIFSAVLMRQVIQSLRQMLDSAELCQEVLSLLLQLLSHFDFFAYHFFDHSRERGLRLPSKVYLDL